MSANEEEKYFVFTEHYGSIEAVWWCKTLKEAKREAKARKKDFPKEAKQVYIGQILFDPNPKKKEEMESAET